MSRLIDVVVSVLYVLGAALLGATVLAAVLGLGYCGAYYAVTGDDIIQTIDTNRAAAGAFGAVVTGLALLALARLGDYLDGWG